MKAATPAYKRSNPFDVDTLGREIAMWGRTGRNMPPAYGPTGMHIPLKGLSGEHIGSLLPGRGAFVDCDLKDLGITKKIPHVFQRSLIRRWSDKIDATALHFIDRFGRLNDPVRAAIFMAQREPFLRGTRGAISSYDGIIAQRANGYMNDVWIGKASFTTTASDWYSGSRMAGTPGVMTLNTTTAPTQTACDRTTAGAWSTGIFSPTGSNKKYLLTFGLNAAQQINFIYLIDIHVQGGAFRLTVGTAETVASPVTIVRNYFPGGGLGSGCWMIGQVTTQTSATATNLTVTYIDQDNHTAETVVIASPATAVLVDQLFPDASTAVGAMPFWALNAGDYGVRQMSSTTSGTSLVAGQVNIQIVTPLVAMPGVAAATYLERDSTVQIDGITELVTSGGVIGCLNAIFVTNTTSTGTMTSFMRTTEG